MIRPHLDKLGLKPFSAFGCILNYLFRPKPPVLDFITEYTSLFSLPTVFAVGIQIRTGDAEMMGGSVKQIHSVKNYNHYFKCASDLVKTHAQPDQRAIYFLITDSNELREDAKRIYGDSMVVSGLGIEPVNVHHGQSNADGIQNGKAPFRSVGGDHLLISFPSQPLWTNGS